MATVAPAGAVNGGGAPPFQEEAPPETLTVKQMGLRAVERAVSENNASVQSLRKTAASMDTGSSLSEQFEAQGGALELQTGSTEEMIGKNGRGDGQIADKEEATCMETYEAQKKLLENQRDSLCAKARTACREFRARRRSCRSRMRYTSSGSRADNVADQLTMAAQTLLISFKTCSIRSRSSNGSLPRLTAALDVMERSFPLGLVGQYQMGYRAQSAG